MRSTGSSWCLCAALISFVVLGASTGAQARPPSMKVQCKQAAERAQMYRNEGKLLSARDELHQCVLPACPAVVRSYCTRWFEEVEAGLPSIVLKVRDGDGNDLSDARVAIDGLGVDAWQGGLPIELDPGSHSIQCTREGNPPAQASVLLGTAEKRRLVTLTIESSLPNPAHLDPPLARVRTTEEPHGLHRPSAAAWVMGAATLAAYGSFAYFGTTGRSELDELRAGCAGHCDQGKVDAAWTKLIIADVSLGVAVLGTGLSTWLFVRSMRGKSDERAPSAPMPATEASLAPLRHGLSLGMRHRF
jgi:hypothetical protein